MQNELNPLVGYDDEYSMGDMTHERALSPLLPPSGNWVKELPRLAKACVAEPTYERATELCSATRRAWAVHFDRYGSSSKPPSARLIREFETSLELCCSALKKCQKVFEKLKFSNLQQLEDIRDYAENAEFRLKCLRLLHKKGAGVPAVQKLVEERCRALVELAGAL